MSQGKCIRIAAAECDDHENSMAAERWFFKVLVYTVSCLVYAEHSSKCLIIYTQYMCVYIYVIKYPRKALLLSHSTDEDRRHRETKELA